MENSLAKMTVKITEAEKIQNTYIKLSEHLSWVGNTKQMLKVNPPNSENRTNANTKLTRRHTSYFQLYLLCSVRKHVRCPRFWISFRRQWCWERQN